MIGTIRRVHMPIYLRRKFNSQPDEHLYGNPYKSTRMDGAIMLEKGTILLVVSESPAELGEPTDSHVMVLMPDGRVFHIWKRWLSDMSDPV